MSLTVKWPLPFTFHRSLTCFFTARAVNAITANQPLSTRCPTLEQQLLLFREGNSASPYHSPALSTCRAITTATIEVSSKWLQALVTKPLTIHQIQCSSYLIVGNGVLRLAVPPAVQFSSLGRYCLGQPLLRLLTNRLAKFRY